MSNEQMINLLNELETGTDLELEINCLGGTDKIQGKYKGGLEQNGYYKPRGGWSCSESEGSVPCYQFLFQEKGKRKLYIMRIGYQVVNVQVI